MGWHLSLQDWAGLAQGLGSIGSLVLLGYISIRVHQHTLRRDKTDFFYRRWQEQQQINVFAISNQEYQSTFEGIVYGSDFKFDRDVANKYTVLFIFINQVQYYYLAHIFGIISRREFEQHAIPALGLICREREVIKYLLEQRGYDKRFTKIVLELLAKATPVTAQSQI